MEGADPLIGYREMAELAGVKPGTLRNYRAQGRLPPPDDDSVPDRPRWRLSTFQAWMAARPGQGTRTDLRDPGAQARGAPAGQTGRPPGHGDFS